MKSPYYFYYLLFSVLLLGCKNPIISTKDKAYQEAIKSNEIKNVKQILVIPGAGCGGCISDATYYVVKNEEKLNKDLAIVFTGVNDRKLLTNEVGDKFIKAKNVFMDKHNFFLAAAIVSNYPTLITMDNDGKVLNVADFSAGDPKMTNEITSKNR